MEDFSPFCGATDTPVLYFWWHLLWFHFKVRVGSLIGTWQKYMSYTFPEIHIWCNTCGPLGQQAMMGLETGIYHATAASHFETKQTLYRLSYSSLVQVEMLCISWNIWKFQTEHAEFTQFSGHTHT